MFLEGTLYIFLIYLAILLGVIILPLRFKNQWNSMVSYFNKVDLTPSQTHKLSLFLLLLGLGFIGGSIVVISLFNMHIFGVLSGPSGFYLFATFAFTLLPLGIGLICGVGFLHTVKSIPLGIFFLFFLCFLFFGFAATNLHDVLWCGTRTGWFAFPVDAGYDLDLWINFFQSPSRDYRVFGFYMGFHVVIFCMYALVNLWRYFHTFLLSNQKTKIKLVFLVFLVIISNN